jgi:hypothetical protein
MKGSTHFLKKMYISPNTRIGPGLTIRERLKTFFKNSSNCCIVFSNQLMVFDFLILKYDFLILKYITYFNFWGKFPELLF